MKQTAVEWLFEKIIDSNHDDDLYEILEQAKEIEREQIEKLKDFDTWKEWKNQ
jgi:hypothetical protein